MKGKKKDNQYKLKKAMAITIDLMNMMKYSVMFHKLKLITQHGWIPHHDIDGWCIKRTMGVHTTEKKHRLGLSLHSYKILAIHQG